MTMMLVMMTMLMLMMTTKNFEPSSLSLKAKSRRADTQKQDTLQTLNPKSVFRNRRCEHAQHHLRLHPK